MSVLHSSARLDDDAIESRMPSTCLSDRLPQHFARAETPVMSVLHLSTRLVDGGIHQFRVMNTHLRDRRPQRHDNAEPPP